MGNTKSSKVCVELESLHVELESLHVEPDGDESEIFNSENVYLEPKRHFIQQLTRNHWLCYSKRNVGKWDFNRVLVESLDTLWIMGLKKEFGQGQRWLQSNGWKLFDDNSVVSVKEAMSRCVGSFLACYALTGEVVFRDQAQDLGTDLLGAFDSPSGLPYRCIDIKTSSTAANSAYNSLSDVASSILELTYLSEVTGLTMFQSAASRIIAKLHSVPKPNGIYGYLMNIETGDFPFDSPDFRLSLGGALYPTLLNAFIQSGGRNRVAIEMYKNAIDSLDRTIRTNDPMGVFIDNFKYMDCDTAYLGGMLALGARVMELVDRKDTCGTTMNTVTRSIRRNQKTNRCRIERHQKLAHDLVEIWYEASVDSSTGLPPTKLVSNGKTAKSDDTFQFGHELAQSYFLLWRLTKDVKYREYAWKLAMEVSSELQDHATHTFPSGLLKFLYLTFCPDCIFPLDQWVFNLAGHPLPAIANDSLNEPIYCSCC